MNNIIYWNCHGVGNSLFKRIAWKLIYKYHPMLFYLVKTHISSDLVDKVARYLGYEEGERVETQRFIGGIWDFWSKSPWSVTVVSHHSQCLTLLPFKKVRKEPGIALLCTKT